MPKPPYFFKLKAHEFADFFCCFCRNLESPWFGIKKNGGGYRSSLDVSKCADKKKLRNWTVGNHPLGKANFVKVLRASKVNCYTGPLI